MSNIARPKKKGLVVQLKVGESIPLDLGVDEPISLQPGVDIKKIRLTLEFKQGQVARLRVEADESVRVGRPEHAPVV